VARVKDRARLSNHFIRSILARARDEFDLCAVSAHLDHLGGLGIGGNEDFGLDPGRRRVSRDGRAAIAGTVLEQSRHALLAQRRNHHRGAAVALLHGYRRGRVGWRGLSKSFSDPSHAEQAQCRAPTPHPEDEVQGEELGAV